MNLIAVLIVIIQLKGLKECISKAGVGAEKDIFDADRRYFYKHNGLFPQCI